MHAEITTAKGLGTVQLHDRGLIGGGKLKAAAPGASVRVDSEEAGPSGSLPRARNPYF